MNNQPSVIRIEPEKIAGSWKWEKDSERIPSNLMILDPEFDSDALPASLPKSMCQYGQTYLKCPFDDRYFLLNEYEDKVLEAKIREIVEILTDLGATYIKWETKLTSVKQRDIDEEFNGAIPQGDLQLKIQTSEKEANSNIFCSEWNNHDKGVNAADYAKAKARAQRCGLENDMVVSTLLHGRNPENIRSKSFKQSTILSSELNKELSVACYLNVLKGTIHIDNTFKKTTCVERKLETTFEVRFEE